MSWSSLASDPDQLSRRVHELGEWFHNLDLNGIKTAPDHFLGDFPNIKWRHIKEMIPEDLGGATVLDIGCNAGFYSIEMKRRGVDVDDRYLNQARFVCHTLGLEIEFEKRSVYYVGDIPGQFDYVLFMGLLYHLRYPLLALDQIGKKTGGRLIFQTMNRGSDELRDWEQDYMFGEKDIFLNHDFPATYFIEHEYA